MYDDISYINMSQCNGLWLYVYIYVHKNACLNFWWVCYQNLSRLGANMLSGKSEICNQDWRETGSSTEGEDGDMSAGA